MEVIQIYDTINKKSLKVKVTPQIAKRCKSDPAYTQALFSQIRNKNFGINSSIKITPVVNELENNQNIKIKTENENWSRNEIIQLINVFQECKSNLDSPNSKPKLWIEISLKLDKRGITKSSTQCRQKWIKLLQAYHQSAYSDEDNKFEYMQEIADALYVRPTSNEEEIFNDSINEETQGQNVKIKENWTKYDTIKFLKIYQRYKKRRANFPSATQLWQRVSETLSKEGIYKSKAKLAIKWKNLYRTYRLCNSNNQSPKKFQFFHEVNCVLNDLDFPDPNPEDVNNTNSSEMKHSLILQAAWTAEETLKLIQLYKKHQQLFKMSNHGQAWKAITEDMLAAGYHKDIQKCKNKWKNLERSFRRNRRNKCTRFYFLNEMKPIMKFKENYNSSDNNESQDEDSLDDDEHEDVMESEEAEVIDSDGNEIFEEIIINNDDNSQFWPQEEISTLIDAYATYHDVLKEKYKSDEIWETISEFMKTKNFTRHATECKDLWNTLFHQYTKARKEGNNDCPFYEEMNNVCTQTEETSINRNNTTKQIKIERIYSIQNDGDSFQNKKGGTNDSNIDDKVDDITFSEVITAPIITDNERHEQNDTIQSKHNCKCAKIKEEGKERRHTERMEMIKKQLEIEERKVKSFEQFVHYLVTRDKDLMSDEEDL